MAQKLIRKTYQADTKAVEEQDRILIVTISTSSPDRSKDVVVPSGMDSANYLKNPVVAAFHRYSEPAIAKTLDLQVTDNAVIAKLQFPPQGVYPLADQLYELYKTGFMNAWSIGFIPKEAVDLDPEAPWSGGHRFEKWELLEYSAVLVPDNPEALTMLRSKGIEEEPDKDETAVVEVDPKEHEEIAVPEATPSSSEEQPVEMIEALDLTPDGKTLSITWEGNAPVVYQLSDHASASLKFATAQQELAPDDNAEVTKALAALRDALKPADKEIGLALRSLKTLLAQPKQ